MYSAIGIPLEVSQKEEEDPRIFFFPLDTKELYKVHVKNAWWCINPCITPSVAGQYSVYEFCLYVHELDLSAIFPRNAFVKFRHKRYAGIIK